MDTAAPTAQAKAKTARTETFAIRVSLHARKAANAATEARSSHEERTDSLWMTFELTCMLLRVRLTDGLALIRDSRYLFRQILAILWVETRAAPFVREHLPDAHGTLQNLVADPRIPLVMIGLQHRVLKCRE